MTLQSSGPISIEDIKTEFGPTKGYSNSLAYYRTTVLGRPSGIVAISEFYGRSAGFRKGIWIGLAQAAPSPGAPIPGFFHSEVFDTPWGQFDISISNSLGDPSPVPGWHIDPWFQVTWTVLSDVVNYTAANAHLVNFEVPHMGWSWTGASSGGGQGTFNAVVGPLTGTLAPHEVFYYWLNNGSIPEGWLYINFV